MIKHAILFEHPSFPLVHKVRNAGIFVKLLIEINYEQLTVSPISKKIYYYNYY